MEILNYIKNLNIEKLEVDVGKLWKPLVGTILAFWIFAYTVPNFPGTNFVKIIICLTGTMGAIFISFVGLHKYPDTKIYRFMILLASVSYFLGDIFWFSRELLFDKKSNLLSDGSTIFYVFTNIFLVLSVIYLVKERIRRWNNMRVIVDGFIIGILMLYILWSLFIKDFHLFSKNILSDGLSFYIDSFYIFTNFLTIFILGVSASFGKIEVNRKRGQIEILGYLLFFITDLAYIYFSWKGTYENTRIIDTAWVQALIVITTTSLEPKTLLESGEEREQFLERIEKKNYFFFFIICSLAVGVFYIDNSFLIPLILLLIFRLFISKYLRIYEKHEILNEHYIASNTQLTESKEINEQLYTLANIDPLTKSFNRRRLIIELETLIKEENSEKYFALLFMDLDRFKSVNDNYGHDMGDLLLIETSERIKNILDSEDILARQGGDEFVIIFRDARDMDKVHRKCKKIVEEIKKPFIFEKKTINTSASLGVAFYPKDADNMSSLLKSADLALYRAKKLGKNRYVLFDEKLKKIEQRKMDIDRCMQTALKNRELNISYLPQIEIKSGNMIGAKGVLRWCNSELGVIPLSEFVEIAEENGMIRELGGYFLNQVAKDVAYFQKKHDPNFKISFNVSPKQFYIDEFIPHIKEVIEKNGLKKGSLHFDILESVSMKNEELFQEKFNKLSDIGIGISIDEFGTQNSSLFHLKKHPITNIIISREFLEGIEKREDNFNLVKGIISICHDLKIITVAEGIETKEQLEILEELKCDIGQGYYFSNPLNFKELEEFF